MKKTLSTLKFAVILLLMASFSCEKKEITVLPPETQTGANTFGCYVNGELFVKDGTAPWMHLPLSATYSRSDKILGIRAYSHNGNDIGLELDPLQINSSIPISLALYSSKNPFCPYFAAKEAGEVIITKFDTVSCIASGRFNFNGQCSDFSLNIHGDSIVSITAGRFDVKFGIVE
ncbi:MAG: hypothetical protein LBK94_08065 [Prevotellaceae bacterium]|jgi:hypothetical protein|nr:hypothetical protein [Prevotellaceae bacterium]